MPILVTPLESILVTDPPSHMVCDTRLAPNIITLGLNSLAVPRMLMGVSRVLLPSCAIHRANPLTSLATKTTGCAPRRLELLHNYGSTEYFIVQAEQRGLGFAKAE